MITRSLILCIACAAVLLLVGCAEEREAAKGPLDPPWSEKDAPDILHALAEDLSAFQGTTGRMPDSLALLDQSGFASGGPYATHAFAYHPSGIGVLRDGWRVVVADDRVRSEHQVWCVVRPPVRLSNAPLFRVVQVPMVEMRSAAAAASGVR